MAEHRVTSVTRTTAANLIMTKISGFFSHRDITSLQCMWYKIQIYTYCKSLRTFLLLFLSLQDLIDPFTHLLLLFAHPHVAYFIKMTKFIFLVYCFFKVSQSNKVDIHEVKLSAHYFNETMKHVHTTKTFKTQTIFHISCINRFFQHRFFFHTEEGINSLV